MNPELIIKAFEMMSSTSKGILAGTAGIACLAKLYCDKEIEYKVQACKMDYLHKELELNHQLNLKEVELKHQLNAKEVELLHQNHIIQSMKEENASLTKKIETLNKEIEYRKEEHEKLERKLSKIWF